MLIKGSLFQSNTATQSGGAIEKYGDLTVQSILNGGASVNSQFLYNSANANGGAIDSDAVASVGSLNVSRATFLGNQSLTGSGGAIETADPTMLSYNTFGDEGGEPTNANVAWTTGGAISTGSDALPSSLLRVCSKSLKPLVLGDVL
jgi:predicted outer membrane repeat protein